MNDLVVWFSLNENIGFFGLWKNGEKYLRKWKIFFISI